MKRLLPERLRLYVRHLGRLRWLTKARKLRTAGSSHPWSGRPLRQARYVLTDPEVDTYTYEIVNGDDLAVTLARLLDIPAEQIGELIAEAQADHELGAGLAAQVGWRRIYLKRHPPLPAHHLAAWVLTRVLRPAVAIETGVLEGLGSRTILRALEINAQDGSDGVLISLDTLPRAGHALVDGSLGKRWEFVQASSPEGLAEAIGGRRVGFLLSDTVPDRDHILSEFDAVFPQLAPGAVLMAIHGWTGAPEKFAARHGGRTERFKEQPYDHFYGGREIGWIKLPG
jgi:hypothetical protein